MILVDTNVLLDLATNDPVWAIWSRQQLARIGAADELAINDVVFAELSVRFAQVADVEPFLDALGARSEAIPREALFLAGKAFQRYRAAGGIRTGVLPDLFIGAHALVGDIPLLTRDARRYRTYFPEVQLIAPDQG